MTHTIVPTLTLLLYLTAAEGVPVPQATLRLFNPTAWEDPTVVEVPVGSIAAPGIIDWSKTRLICDGKELPFAIREGQPHWKARLESPVVHPRSEDLLVFACAVQQGAWTEVEVEVTAGTPETKLAVNRADGQITIDYPACRAVIDEGTGSLLSWEAFETRLLSGPFTVTPYRLADGYQLAGPFGVGYTTASVGMRKSGPVAQAARCVSLSSNAALTEVNFVIEPAEGPALALTYRLHVCGSLEIVVDERPWSSRSPWLNHAVEYALPLAGTEQRLPYLENRWAFYGFREYTASVKSIACAHIAEKASVLELGGELANGRQFVRRLIPVAAERQGKVADLAELADEGLAIEVLPAHTPPIDHPVRIVDEAQAAAVLAELTEALNGAGVELAKDGTAEVTTIRLTLVPDTDEGISGDGYALAADETRYTLRARTRLGLYGAVRAVATHLQRHGREGGLPLTARNPAVNLRGGGFGGGDFEVDFPYADDAEWCRVFDGLLDSGMNVFACMGMWANWKMPVSYKYMPELRTGEADAYDESSGTKFAELDYHRDHGLKLAKYLQDRGGQVWLWVPIGCVPTSYAKRFPEAMAPRSDKIPCFTHPEYARYMDAFFRELLETYPLDGLFLVRDDNGGICTCDRCKAYVAQSRTNSPVWEQYLIIYDYLRNHGFRGAVAVYPYFDNYEPKLDPLLPQDLYIVGHGSGVAALSRNYEYFGPMGDTWIDNLYANFRLAPSPRMKRLLADRGSFWIGGAYVGCELPWESVGFFGWEPTATPNSLRWGWAAREFGRRGAESFLEMNDAYEELWDIMALPLVPADWMKLHPPARAAVVQEGEAGATRFRDALERLRKTIDAEKQARWLGHLDLYAPFFEYHLHRLAIFAEVYDQLVAHQTALDRPEGLPSDVRNTVLARYAETYEWARKYDQAMQKAPDGMLSHCRWMTKPYKEWMAGYDQWLDWKLPIKQFAGTVSLETDALRPGEPFVLRVKLHNQGVCPWMTDAGQRLELTGEVEKLGLPATWEYQGEPMAPGDRRTIELRGKTPREPGVAKLTVAITAPYRVPEKFATAEVPLEWK